MKIKQILKDKSTLEQDIKSCEYFIEFYSIKSKALIKELNKINEIIENGEVVIMKARKQLSFWKLKISHF